MFGPLFCEPELSKHNRKAFTMAELFDAMENKDFLVNGGTMRPGLIKVESMDTLAEKLGQFTSE